MYSLVCSYIPILLMNDFFLMYYTFKNKDLISNLISSIIFFIAKFP